MEDLEKYPHLYEFLPDNFIKKAKEVERDVEHSVITTLKNNPNHLQVWDNRIEQLKDTSGKDILDRYADQAHENRQFQGFLAEMNCYFILKDFIEDLDPINEDSFSRDEKPADFHSEIYDIDVEATHIGKHEPEAKLYSLLKDWLEDSDKSYRVELVKKDNYNKFPTGYHEISVNGREVENLKKQIQQTDKLETIETPSLKVSVEESDGEDSVFVGSGWESAEFIPDDPSGSIRDRVKKKANKDPISENLIIYLDIDVLMKDIMLRKILQGPINDHNGLSEPEVSDKINTKSKIMKRYMESEGIIPSEDSFTAINSDNEGIFLELDGSVIGVIGYLPTGKQIFIPNIYSKNEKVAEIFGIFCSEDD